MYRAIEEIRYTYISVLHRSVSSLYSSTAVNSTRTSDSSTAADESPQEANEASLATEIYSGESLEVNRKPSKAEEKFQAELVGGIAGWMTPKTTVETNKETATEVFEEKNTLWNSEDAEFPEVSTLTSKSIRNETNGALYLSLFRTVLIKHL